MNRSTAPEIKPLGQPELLHPVIHRQDKQIPLFCFNAPGSNVLRVEWTVSGGNFVKTKTPQADFAANLITEGTQSWTSKQVADMIDFYGASFQGENSFSEQVFTLHCTKDSLKDLLPVVKEIFLCPAYPETEFSIYMNRAIERLKVKWKKVSHVASVNLSALMHPGHILGQITTEKDLQELDRQDVVDFYEKHIRNNFAHCMAAGDIDEEITQMLVDFNAQLGEAAAPTGREYTIPAINKNSIKKVDIPNAIQSCIVMAYLAVPRRHADFVPLQLLNTILGGYFGSRLMSNLREDKGWTYGIGSGMNISYGFGYLSISTEVGAEVTEKAIAEILYEVNRLCQEEVGEQELELAKNYLIGSFIRNSDGVFAMADRFRPIYSSDLGYEYYDHYFRTIRKMTSKDIKDLANKYLNRPYYLSVAGKAGSE